MYMLALWEPPWLSHNAHPRPLPNLDVLGLGAVALLRETKAFHYSVFRRQQFSCLAPFYGENVPAGTLGHAALSGFDEGFVYVHAPAMAPAFGPAGFVMDIVEGGVPKTESGHDLGNELSGHGVPLQREVRDWYDKFLRRVQALFLSPVSRTPCSPSPRPFMAFVLSRTCRCGQDFYEMLG
jgi:hypothetical protein